MFRKTFTSCYRTVVLQRFSVVSLCFLQCLRPCGAVTVRESFSVRAAARFLPASAMQKWDRTSTVLTDLNFSFPSTDRNTQAFALLSFAGQDMFAFQFSSNAQMEIDLRFFLLISEVGRAEARETIQQKHLL